MPFEYENEDKGHNVFLLGCLCWVVIMAALFGGVQGMRCLARHHSSGVGQSADVSVPLHTEAVPPPAAPAPSAAVADARLSGQGEVQSSTIPSESLSGGDAVRLGVSGALTNALAGFDFSEPNPETIAWMTIDLWEQPEFLELTQDEAHELLALDDYMGLKGPDTLLSIAGPLPTLEDCHVGFASQAVQDALKESLLLEATLIRLGEIPDFRRPHWAEQRRLELVRMKEQAELDLMLALEKATGKEWRVWCRLYWRWSSR